MIYIKSVEYMNNINLITPDEKILLIKIIN